MLKKIKELHVKAETAKVLFCLADDEGEKKHFKRLLDKYKDDLIKIIEEPKQKISSKSDQAEQRKLGAILADSEADLKTLDNEPSLFD